MKESCERTPRRTLTILLSIAFVVALVMGPGPGILLVNTSEPLFGFPRIYLWGLLWFVVELAVVVLAYVFVWPDDDEES